MEKEEGLPVILLFLFGGGAVLEAQMDAYFTAINHPVPQDTMMVMLLSDFQSARSTNDFFTGMDMVQYGLTPRWTVGFMAEGQKIFGFPTTYGGLRINRYLKARCCESLKLRTSWVRVRSWFTRLTKQPRSCICISALSLRPSTNYK